MRKQSRLRLAVQLAAAALFNGYAVGFAKGDVYTGVSKAACVPVLNCYSCPGALGACPIGALQAVLGGARHRFSFYVFGLIMLFGVVLGRFICGFLCPFGLVQDLLHRIPLRKWRVPAPIDRPLRYLKYLIALVAVILLPIFATNAYGLAPPYFCQWICPAGTLGGGLPLLATNPDLRDLIGGLFAWKFFLMALILGLSIVIARPFCKYLCPLGAFYALFNRFSFYQMHVDSARCIGCKQCARLCPMDVDPTVNSNDPECIRCGKCKAGCPVQCISSGLRFGAEAAPAPGKKALEK